MFAYNKSWRTLSKQMSVFHLDCHTRCNFSMNPDTSTNITYADCSFNHQLLHLQKLVHIIRQTIDELAWQFGDTRGDVSLHRRSHPRLVASAHVNASLGMQCSDEGVRGSTTTGRRGL